MIERLCRSSEASPHSWQTATYLSSILEELKVNLRDSYNDYSIPKRLKDTYSTTEATPFSFSSGNRMTICTCFFQATAAG